MILSRPNILASLENQELHFDPPVSEDQVAQVSINLRLGRKFITLKKVPGVAAICMDPFIWESRDLWKTEDLDSYTLKPGKFVLAQTLEYVHIPLHLMGFIEGRSSYARLGIAVHLTAPKIDPGYRGHITLEMVNFGVLPVELRAEIDTPAQLLLAKIDPRLSEGYGSKSTDTFQGSTSPLPLNKNKKDE